jgi:hypothetical protein
VIEALAHAFVAASGSSLSDCHFIAQRFENELGFDPGRDESFVCRVEGGSMRLVLGGRCWLNAIWRAPDGAVFVTDGHHGVHVARDGLRFDLYPVRGTPTGVWGVDRDHVWVWGLTNDARAALWYWDGTQLVEAVAPGFVGAVGGSGAVVFAVGRGGLVARLHENSSQVMDSVSDGVLTDVCVSSDRRAYAVGHDGTLLAGSIHGWVVERKLDFPLHCCAALDESVWLGASYPHGVMKLTADGIEAKHRSFDVIKMQAGSQALLVTTTTDLLAVDEAGIQLGLPISSFEGILAGVYR